MENQTSYPLTAMFSMKKKEMPFKKENNKKKEKDVKYEKITAKRNMRQHLFRKEDSRARVLF